MRPVVSAIFAAFALCAAAESIPLPVPETGGAVLLEGMPSFGQRNLEFTGGGKSFCAPTAASNALMWLSDRGYPALKPTGADCSSAQKEMIKQLAGLMGTFREGTSIASFKCGINTYLRNAGYAPKAWAFSGHGSPTGALTPPDLDLVKKLSLDSTVLWLGLGWYELDESSRTFKRRNGHWVTLVGYGKDQAGRADQPCFVIADPETPSGYRYVTLNLLQEGRISNGSARRGTQGYYSFAELDTQIAGRAPRYCVLESIQALTLE